MYLKVFINAFDGYVLTFIIANCIYGLFVDIKWSRDKGTNRDAKLAKRIYISMISLGILFFITSMIIS